MENASFPYNEWHWENISNRQTYEQYEKNN